MHDPELPVLLQHLEAAKHLPQASRKSQNISSAGGVQGSCSTATNCVETMKPLFNGSKTLSRATTVTGMMSPSSSFQLPMRF